MKLKLTILTLIFVAAQMFTGCGDIKGDYIENTPPHVNVYDNPADGDTLSNAPVIYWWASDKDGIIGKYQYIDVPANFVAAARFDSFYVGTLEIPDSIIFGTGVAKRVFKWKNTTSSADTIYLSLEAGDSVTKHLFCVRAFDNDSLVSDAKCRIIYRTNRPPDSLIIRADKEDSTAELEAYVDTLWVLENTTWDWYGYRKTWDAHDPDKSIILEYYWWIENVDSGRVVRDSRADDSVFFAYQGEFPDDGWIRNNSTTIRGDIPTGLCRFIVKVRDDARYEGVQDTVTFYAVQPYFDPSIDANKSAMLAGTFNHRMKAFYLAPGPSAWNPAMKTFYNGIFDQLRGGSGLFSSYDVDTSYRASFTGVDLNVTPIDLRNYSIVYVFLCPTSPVLPRNALSQKALDMLRDYVIAGGRVIFDGRGFFENIPGFVDSSTTNPVGQIPFDMFGVTWQSSDQQRIRGAKIADASRFGMSDITVDATKLTDGLLPGIKGLGTYGHFMGVPYAMSLYGGIGESDTSDITGRQVHIRFAKPDTRGAIFAFPLYYMDNSNGRVTTALRKTFEFLCSSFSPTMGEEDSTETAAR